MAFLDKLKHIGLDDRKIDENELDSMIKEFIDSLFGGNALDIIKYKYPKLNRSLEDLTQYHRSLGLKNNLDEVDFKVEIAKHAYKLTNLDKKEEELNRMKSNVRELSEAKKKLIAKKDHLIRLQKKGNVIDNLKSDTLKVKSDFRERYDKTKAIEKVLEAIGFKSLLSTESMDKLREDISNHKSRIEKIEEFTQLFEGINSEHDLKLKINLLNEELKNYKDFFIKTEEEN